ncbi:MAG TPA: AI-2E family transporter [Beutenbergiaceae bacterium]|nr:AI-2E family transporter [Beutenbergiaceae bacterium]
MADTENSGDLPPEESAESTRPDSDTEGQLQGSAGGGADRFDEDEQWSGPEIPAESMLTDVSLQMTPGETAIPFAVRAGAGWAWRFIAIVAASAIFLWLLVQIKTVVIPVFVAGLVTALLAPMTNFFSEKLKFPRSLAATVSLLMALGAVTGLVFIVSATITDDVRQLGEKAVQGFNEVVAWLSSGPLNLEESAIQEYIDKLQQQVSQNMDRILSGAMSVTSSVGHVFAGALIALFCLFFFLKDGREIWTWVVRLFPARARERVDGAGLRSWLSLGAYTRTQIMVALVDGIGIGLGALLLGVPLAIPIGVLVFLGSFIPIVGATVTGAVAVAVALVDSGLGTAVAMLVVVLLVQQLESNLLQPMLMSKALSLHPVGVLLAVAAGTIVAGIVGALFAVPILAIVNTALQYLNGHDPAPPSRRKILIETTRRWRRA